MDSKSNLPYRIAKLAKAFELRGKLYAMNSGEVSENVKVTYLICSQELAELLKSDGAAKAISEELEDDGK